MLLESEMCFLFEPEPHLINISGVFNVCLLIYFISIKNKYFSQAAEGERGSLKPTYLGPPKILPKLHFLDFSFEVWSKTQNLVFPLTLESNLSSCNMLTGVWTESFMGAPLFETFLVMASAFSSNDITSLQNLNILHILWFGDDFPAAE